MHITERVLSPYCLSHLSDYIPGSEVVGLGCIVPMVVVATSSKNICKIVRFNIYYTLLLLRVRLTIFE